MLEARIKTLLEEKFKEEGFTDLFLVELNIGSNGFKIKVFIDSDTGVHFRQCARISRYLEEHLEEENLVPEKYTIEVSSPGVSRPLVMKRQYPKHIGREFEIKLKNEPKKIKGELVSVEEDYITLEVMPKPKKGVSIKNLEKEKIDLKFEDIDRAMVQVSFS